MSGRVIFLLEELSMHRTLQGLLPRMCSGWQEGVHWLAFPHQGKSDLEKSIPRKLRAWRAPSDRFVIMRDNDGGDCRQLEQKLQKLAKDKPAKHVLIHIVVQELEGWFLGDFNALGAAYPDLNVKDLHNRAKYREPEKLTNASEELGKLVPGYRKTAGAQRIAPHLSLSRNKNPSFGTFVAAVRDLARSMA